MSRKTIYIVIFLAVASLLGVITTQIFWVKRAYTLQDKAFNDRVVSAMTMVVDQILTMNHDSALVEPVEIVSENFFVANINDTLHPYLLETLLRQEFEKENLTEEFEYGIYDCFNDSIVFGSKVSFEEAIVSAKQEEISIQKRFDKDGHYFGVYYPKKNIIIWSQMDFWTISSALLLLVVIVFAYTISIVLRQKRLSEIKTDFINNMTHELKTPISTISLSSEVLLGDEIVKTPERLKQYAQIIQNENNRLKTQVDRVLQVATLSPDNVSVKQQEIDLHEVITRAVATFEVKVAEQSGIIQTDLLATHHHITGDLVHITNIIYNLLDNACKYTADKPEIKIETKNKGGDIQISISDKGIGIQKQYLKMIFDKFFRVPTGNLHDVKGFGLGLFYVRTIVEAHGGKINVSSEPNVGSTFTINLKANHEG